MREPRVRTVFLLSLATLVLACTDGGPEPKTQVSAQAKPAVVAPAIVEPQPGEPNTSAQPKEVAPEVTPDSPPQPEAVAPEEVEPEAVAPVEVAPIITPPYDGPPRLEVVAREVSAEDMEYEGLCPFKLEARGFPAISEDGATLIGAYDFYDGRAEIKDHLELTWVDATSTRLEQAYAPPEPERPLAEDEEPPEIDLVGDCKKSEARTRKRIEQLNAELHARKWRGLEILDALFSKPGYAQALETFASMDGGAYVDEVVQKLAAADRPLEVYYHAGHLIGRVRGTRVLQDTVLPDYRQHENEFCDTAPNIAAIYFDPATKVALMKYNHHEEGCLCDEHNYFARIELSPELLAEAELRKTTKFRSAYATYMVVLENE